MHFINSSKWDLFLLSFVNGHNLKLHNFFYDLIIYYHNFPSLNLFELFYIVFLNFIIFCICARCRVSHSFQLLYFPYAVSGVQSLSSSVQSTPSKNGHSDDASRSTELLQEFLKSGPKKILFQTCFDNEKKHKCSSPSKCKKMAEQPPKTVRKTLKNQDPKKPSISPKVQPTRKHNRKSENPTRIPVATEQCAVLKCSNSLICKNSACRAVLSIEDTFCKRCSCCICHLFDDNKDPSLWLECNSESGGHRDSCSLSCHIECALQRGKVGVVDLGQLMQLDGSYCCASCGKVSGILGYVLLNSRSC